MERTTTETILAIIVGIVLGTVVAVSIWMIKSGKINLNLASRLNKSVTTQKPTPSPQNSAFTLVISQPKDNIVVNDPKITLSGKTAESARVLIAQNSQDSVVNTDQDGFFKTNITLDEGDNEIIVTSFLASGQSKQQSLTLVYQKK